MVQPGEGLQCLVKQAVLLGDHGQAEDLRIGAGLPEHPAGEHPGHELPALVVEPGAVHPVEQQPVIDAAPALGLTG